MRVEKFDEQDKAALGALKFDIADDGEVAKLSGEMTIEIVRPDAKRIELQITLPDGMTTLTGWCPRERLLEAGGVEEDA